MAGFSNVVLDRSDSRGKPAAQFIERFHTQVGVVCPPERTGKLNRPPQIEIAVFLKNKSVALDQQSVPPFHSGVGNALA